MSKHQQKFSQPLTGQFLGWGDDRLPHRYIKIVTANGERLVKVAKSLRPSIQDWQPGIWLTLLAKQQVNPETGETKIKVKQLLTPPCFEPASSRSIEQMIKPVEIKMCQGSSCRRRGSERICRAMETYIDRHELKDRVEIKQVKCLHQCKAAPHAIFIDSAPGVQPEKTHYRQVQNYQVKSILNRHLPIDSSQKAIEYNLIRKIGNYLHQQIGSTSTAL